MHKILVLIFIFFSLNIYSLDEVTFRKNWNASSLWVGQNDSEQIFVKIFKRTTWINKTEISLVNTALTMIQNPKGETDLAKLADTMARSIDPTIKVTKVNKGYHLVGISRKINRKIYIDLNFENKRFVVISSFVRLGFDPDLQLEVSELHETILNQKMATTSFIKFLQNVFIKDAYSQTLPPGILINGGNIAVPPTISLDSSALQATLNTLNGTVLSSAASTQNLATSINGAGATVSSATQAMSTSINGLSSSIGTSSQTMAGSVNGVATSLTGASQTMATSVNGATTAVNRATQTVSTVGNTANANWAQTNIQIGSANQNIANMNQQFSGMNTNWAESNKLLAQMLNPSHMARIAAYTAAGAALGAISVNFAIEGVSTGISFLYELFSGEKKKQLEWRDFETAMSMWDNQLNDLVKLEQAVDSYLAAFNFLGTRPLPNNYLQNLRYIIRDMNFDKELFLEKFKDKNLSNRCRQIYYNAADELSHKVDDYQKIIQFVSTNGSSNVSGENYFCTQLRDLQRKILAAENTMQDLRLKILMAESQFYENIGNGLKNSDKRVADINGRVEKQIKARTEFSDSVSERIEDEKKNRRSEWLSQCMDGKNEEGKKINQEYAQSFLGTTFGYFKRREKCSLEYARIAKDSTERSAEGVATIKTQDEIRRKLTLASNSFVDMHLSEEQLGWMSRVHVDAYCYQYAHKKTVPEICKNYPELLYSVSLSSGYDKAASVYDNKCKDQYLNGLQKLRAQ